MTWKMMVFILLTLDTKMNMCCVWEEGQPACSSLAFCASDIKKLIQREAAHSAVFSALP